MMLTTCSTDCLSEKINDLIEIISSIAHLTKTYRCPEFKPLSFCSHTSPSPAPSSHVQELCNLVSIPDGSLDDLESSLGVCGVPLTSFMVVQVVERCKYDSPSRRLFRFFTWSCKRLKDMEDRDFNSAVRVFAEMKDGRAMEILLSEIRKEGRLLDAQTFCVVVDTLVKMGREDDALGIFKNSDKFGCPQDKTTVTAIVTALCTKGHALRAEGVLHHHNDKISGVKSCVYKSLLHGWSLKANVKEARRILQEMKSKKVILDLFCFNTFLRCLCENNLKKNPSGLVPEALNVMMEMRSYNIMPNSISYNILLSCLGKARRVKESLKVFESMRRVGCEPDWVSYYLVARVLYLSGRFGKGNQIVEKMIEAGVEPPPKFYHNLVGVLCGVERVNFAIELLECMKRSSVGEYGPVYDLLIPKLCRAGDFGKGKELWDEAKRMGVALCCSRDVLDPSITEVFVYKKLDDQERLVGEVEVGIPIRKVERPETMKLQKRRIRMWKMKKKKTIKNKRKMKKTKA